MRRKFDGHDLRNLLIAIIAGFIVLATPQALALIVTGVSGAFQMFNRYGLYVLEALCFAGSVVAMSALGTLIAYIFFIKKMVP